MHRFSYIHASSLQAAQGHLTEDGKTQLKAGGIDLLDLLKERLITPNTLVNLRTVSGLSAIQVDPTKGAEIGALTTLQQIADDTQLKVHYPCLAQAAGLVATPQIRNVATLGGNLCQRPRCWYFRSEEFHCRKKGGRVCYAQQGENAFHAIYANTTCAIVHPSALAVALLALDANVTVYDGKRMRQLPIAQLFVTPETNILREISLKPTEIITSIQLPAPAPQRHSLYIKQKQKQSFDWPLLELAVVLDVENNQCQRARVVLGAVAPVPWRMQSIEQALQGKPLTDANIQRAAQLVRQGANPLQDNAYKLPLAETLVARALRQVGQNNHAATQPATRPAPTTKPTTQP